MFLFNLRIKFSQLPRKPIDIIFALSRAERQNSSALPTTILGDRSDLNTIVDSVVAKTMCQFLHTSNQVTGRPSFQSAQLSPIVETGICASCIVRAHALSNMNGNVRCSLHKRLYTTPFWTPSLSTAHAVVPPQENNG